MDEITTLTIFKEDHKRIEQLRLKHSLKLGENVRVRDFVRHLIETYEKARR